MQLLGTFETVSELAVALAGFSGIVTVLSDRKSTPWGQSDWFRLKALLVWSLGVAFLALVPSGLSAMPEVTAPWRVAHGIFAVFHGSCLAWYFWADHQRPPSSKPAFPAGLNRITLPLAILLFLTEIAVAGGYFAGSGAVLYLLVLVWFLFMAAITFSLLLFPHESEKPDV